jgi:hypothetical protein
MGVVCCSKPQSLKDEEFIQKIFVQITIISYQFKDYEKMLAEKIGSNYKEISHTEYNTFICPTLYNTHPSDKFFIFHDNFFDKLYYKVKLESVYDLNFYIFSFFNKLMEDVNIIIKNFYSLFCRMKNMSNKSYIDFYRIVEDYLYVNIMMPTEILYEKYTKEKDKYFIDDLHKEIFSQKVFEKYLVNFFGEGDYSYMINKNGNVTFNFFMEFFERREFVFDFCELRNNFYEFYFNNL